MPDITMRNNSSCVLKETCYRYKAIPKPLFQSYQAFEWEGTTFKQCNFYEKIEPHHKIKK